MLNLSPLFADSMLGMNRAEGDGLLRWLANHITDEARAYDHDWQEGDMVLWDNWRMLHCARGVPEGAAPAPVPKSLNCRWPTDE